METLFVGCGKSHAVCIALPSISHIGADGAKREEEEYQKEYSAADSLSRPELRKIPDDKKEPLPSIYEVLGLDRPLSFSAMVPLPSSITAAHYDLRTSAAISSAEQQARDHCFNLQNTNHGPSNPSLHSRGPFLGVPASLASSSLPSQIQAGSLPRSPSSELRPWHSSPQHNPELPTFHSHKIPHSPQTSATRPDIPYTSHPPLSTRHESSTPQPTGPMNQHCPYSQDLPSYPLWTTSADAPSAAYSPKGLTYPVRPRCSPKSSPNNAQIACLDGKKSDRLTLKSYDKSTKLHLEGSSLETLLHEISDGSRSIVEFSTMYYQEKRGNQRISMTPQCMPRLEEADDMLKQSERIMMSLRYMRDIVSKHRQASIVEASQDSPYRSINGCDDSVTNHSDDTKRIRVCAGGDTKNRKRDVSVL